MQKQQSPLGEPYKVTLTKGMKGQYGWEVEARGDSVRKVITDVNRLNMELRKAYDGAQEKEGE